MIIISFDFSEVILSNQFVKTSTPNGKGIQEPANQLASPIIDEQSNVREKRNPSDCDVVVTIDWEDRTKRKVLPPELSSLGKMLCRGTKKQIARAAWQCKAIRSDLYAEIVKEIHKESVMMCVKENTKVKKRRDNSCLRETDKESMSNFSFDTLIKELEERAPLLLLVLKTAAFNARDENEKWKATITVAAAVCLRNRCRNMIAFQLLIAILNRHSGFMVSKILKTMEVLFPNNIINMYQLSYCSLRAVQLSKLTTYCNLNITIYC